MAKRKDPGTKEPCHVCDTNCEHPAGWRNASGYAENKNANAPYRCHECSEPVCAACSVNQNGRIICLDCKEY